MMPNLIILNLNRYHINNVFHYKKQDEIEITVQSVNRATLQIENSVTLQAPKEIQSIFDPFKISFRCAFGVILSRWRIL